MSGELFARRAGWARTVRYAPQASQWFWKTVRQRCPGLFEEPRTSLFEEPCFEERCAGLPPERDVELFFAGFGRLASGGDDPAGRAALLTVLARAHRRYGLRPEHYRPIGEALIATVARFDGRSWRPEQGPGWRRSVKTSAEAVARAAAGVGDGPVRWPYTVVEHDRVSPTVVVLTVSPNWRCSPYRPGQAIPVNLPGRPGRWRWYSPANAPRADGTVTFHVRAVAGGGISGALLRAVRPGETILLGPPAGADLVLDPADDPGRDLLLIAGGTGLAPLRALVEQLAADGGDGRRVTLVLGARHLDDVYDAVALDKLQSAHGWLTVVVALSAHPAVGEAEHGDALSVGLRCYEPGQEVYVCGPPAMIAEARRRLPGAGIPADRIHLPANFTTSA
jgi:NAD(P)H-flavin reductase